LEIAKEGLLKRLISTGKLRYFKSNVKKALEAVKSYAIPIEAPKDSTKTY